MKNRKRFIQTTALIASSIATMVPGGSVKAGQPRESKKARLAQSGQPRQTPGCDEQAPPDPARLAEYIAAALSDAGPDLADETPDRADERASVSTPGPAVTERYPWKKGIVTTTFWIGEKPTRNNLVPNHRSAWDRTWAENYGGTDTPDPKRRVNYHPDTFIPKLNPFYIALPYNDLAENGHKAEASKVIPWFKEEFKGPGVSVLKSRWIAIRHKGRVAYAQWEDCGPFRSDHDEYVFGDARPRPNLNKGAGLDVSPAVRDYLRMKDTDVTDWRFVEIDEIPDGPWKRYGENNQFVQQRRDSARKVALESIIQPGGG